MKKHIVIGVLAGVILTMLAIASYDATRKKSAESLTMVALVDTVEAGDVDSADGVVLVADECGPSTEVGIEMFDPRSDTSSVASAAVNADDGVSQSVARVSTTTLVELIGPDGKPGQVIEMVSVVDSAIEDSATSGPTTETDVSEKPIVAEKPAAVAEKPAAVVALTAEDPVPKTAVPAKAAKAEKVDKSKKDKSKKEKAAKPEPKLEAEPKVELKLAPISVAEEYAMLEHEYLASGRAVVTSPEADTEMVTYDMVTREPYKKVYSLFNVNVNVKPAGVRGVRIRKYQSYPPDTRYGNGDRRERYRAGQGEGHYDQYGQWHSGH